MKTIITDGVINKAKLEMKGIVRAKRWPTHPIEPNKHVIACYTAAIAINFTDWMGKTLPWVRHEKSRMMLTDNIRCESMDDRVGMLINFARSCNAFPQEAHFNQVAEDVQEIRRLFKNPCTAGLSGIALMAILENTSEIFIPVLKKIAIRLGSSELEYTQVHGVADIEHSKGFAEALDAELSMGYSREEKEVFTFGTQALVGNLFCSIFSR